MSNNPVLSSEERDLEKAWQSVEAARKHFLDSLQNGWGLGNSKTDVVNALETAGVPIWIAYAVNAQLDAIISAMHGELKIIQDQLQPMVGCLDTLLETAWCSIGGMPCRTN